MPHVSFGESPPLTLSSYVSADSGQACAPSLSSYIYDPAVCGWAGIGHTGPESQHQDFRWIWVLSGTVADSLLVIIGTQVVLVVKNLPADAGDAGDPASIPGSGRSLRGRHGNPLQYSCLENTQGQRHLAGYSLWGHKESEMTEVTEHTRTWEATLSMQPTQVKIKHFLKEQRLIDSWYYWESVPRQSWNHWSSQHMPFSVWNILSY